MRKTIVAALLTLFFPLAALPAPPRLVVNVVVSQMRYDYLQRFGHNMAENGLRRFVREGIVFTDARYNFMQTTTPTTLATLTTGANPSSHGVVGERWIDYTGNRTVRLIEDYSVAGLDSDAGRNSYSNQHLMVPTLGDKLKEENRSSKIITIAADPVSAVVAGGFTNQVYWMDQDRGNWVSSTAYADALPEWVNRYNSMRIPAQYLDYNWKPLLQRSSYINSIYSMLEGESAGKLRKIVSLEFLRRRDVPREFTRILYTPAGNSLVTEFAKQAIVYENLGKDENTDIINIIYDSPRYAGRLFGPESMEVEDMFYRLDKEIEELLTFIFAQADQRDVVVVLTSDHGASDSYDFGRREQERFNVNQFKVIMNGFMNAQYGSGDWVLDYSDRQLFLNRTQVYSRGLVLEEVQNRVAAFALQFRGVSHVLTSTALQNSSFHGGYAEKMQNGFYPKRSGDLMVNLMPGWIEEDEEVRSASGSMYEYDTHVPLMIMGPLFYGQRINRTVDMKDLAPTLARIIGIGRPIAAEGEPIDEIARLLD